MVYNGSRRIQATAKFMGCSSLALFLEMYLLSRVTISLNSIGTSETYPIRRVLRFGCIVHLISCNGATSWTGGPCSASLAGGCGGKMRVIMILKLSVGLATRLPSVEMVSWPIIHSRNWWICTWGILVSLLIGQSHRIISVLSSAVKPLSSIIPNTNWKISLTCDLLTTPLPQSERNVVILMLRSQSLLIKASANSKVILWVLREDWTVFCLKMFWHPLTLVSNFWSSFVYLVSV